MMKRIFDFTAALLGLMLALPLMLLLAILVKLDSPGSVIFSQTRLGKAGKHFKVHKIRKFPVSAGTSGSGVTVAGDVRMTRVGRFLERSKLDELPQLYNILKGDMSFVGPRPESLRYADLFKGEFEAVLQFIPGVFGPNQIEFRNESDLYPADQDPDAFYRSVLFPKKARRDIAYFKRSNWLKDIQWIIKGVWVSLIGAIHWRRVIGLHAGVVLVDIIAIEAAWWLAYQLRYSEIHQLAPIPLSITGAWLYPAIVVPLLLLGGCYQRPVRHFGIGDAIRLLKSAMVGWGLASFVFLAFYFRNQSLLLGPLGLLISLPLMTIPRLWYRDRWYKKIRRSRVRGNQKHILLYGAGDQGSALALLLDHGYHHAKLIGFLDDNAELRGRYIRGYKVYGMERDIPAIYAQHRIDQLWLSFIPDKQKYRRIKQRCAEMGIELIIFPLTEPFLSLADKSGEAGKKSELQLEDKIESSRVHDPLFDTRMDEAGSKLTH
jgi:lipopolysaccharide/colanic/teichoic acid biosynthesis glycosyltransferase